MDNASIHHVCAANTKTKAKVILLPPCSPDLNPLEPVSGKVKTIVKEIDKLFQLSSAPQALLAQAFGIIIIPGVTATF